jgi:hypothetical protein
MPGDALGFPFAFFGVVRMANLLVWIWLFMQEVPNPRGGIP